MLNILGGLCILGGIYFLLVNLKWIRASGKTDPDKPIEAQKVDNILIRLFSIVTICIGIYFIYPGREPNKKEMPNQQNPGQANSPGLNSEKWNDELLGILIKQCQENGKKTAENYPDLVNDYCKCATEKISSSLTPEQYTQIMSKPKEEQAADIRPLVQTCADILTKLIQLSEEAKPEFERAKK